MDDTQEEMSIIEASGGKEDQDNENNNYVKNENSKELTGENNAVTAEERTEKKKKFFHRYIYQQDYQEALRSLLWEPYDCRNDSQPWYFQDFEDIRRSGISSTVPKRKSLSSSDSSLSSFSSYSSIDEILTVEMTQKSALSPEEKYSMNIEVPKEKRRGSSMVPRKGGKDLKLSRTKEKTIVMSESKLKEEKEGLLSEFSECRCSTDPVQNLMNIKIMVSDLHVENGEGISSTRRRNGAPESQIKKKCASASQYEIGSCDVGISASDRDANVLNTVSNMLVTVEGTLEPRDSNEGTQLVSPDTSLDLNDNPVRFGGQNRAEPGPSVGNVSVVNCYRAVPVSVVSTVPTIKCLNTQENVSNVNIIQTSSTPEQKLTATKRLQPQAKRLPVRSPNGPLNLPSTSRVRTKTARDINRNHSRHSAGVEQIAVNHLSKGERERPKSINTCSGEISLEQGVLAPGSSEDTPTSSNNGSSVLSNHNRSISNPVLGNSNKPAFDRYGSQQNIPIRLETHFGPNSPDGAERSQVYLTQRSVPPAEAQGQQETVTTSGNDNNVLKPSPRTFTSTEAQTDDLPIGIEPQSVINREQRRRERRERRHQRRLHQSVLNSGSVWQTNVDMIHRDRRGLPDILNSHMPPPYSAVPMPATPAMPPPLHVPPPMPVPPGPQTVPHLVDSPPGPPLPHQNGIRFPFPFPGGRR